MGSYGNDHFLQRIEQHKAKTYEPSLTWRIAQLEKGYQDLTLALAEANKTISLQRAEIRELQRDMNDLITKDLTIECENCSQPIKQCTCIKQEFP